jgi:uncharacterized protein YraI
VGRGRGAGRGETIFLDLSFILYSNEGKARREEIVRTAAALFCVSILALLSGELNAAPATIEHSARLRSGPSTSHRVVATLPRGTTVDLSGCRGGWCEVASRGRRGYVAEDLLAVGNAPLPGSLPTRPANEYDYPGFDFPGPTYGPAASVTVQPRWSHRRWSRSRYQGPRRWRNYPVVGVPAVRTPDRPTVGGAGAVLPPPTSSLGAASEGAGRSPAAPSVAAPASRNLAAPVTRGPR